MISDIRTIIEGDEDRNKLFTDLIEKDRFIWKKFSVPAPILKWLANFDDEEQVRLALILANSIQYYNSDEVRELLDQILSKSVKEYLIELFSEINDENIDTWFIDFLKNECIFIGLGPAGKSGQMLAYFFAHLPITKGIKIFTESEFLSDYSRFASVKFIFLIDDFIGTGTQVINYWRKRRMNPKSFEEIYRENPELKFIYLALVGYYKGKEKIEENIPIKVILGEELNNEDKCFSDVSRIYNIESDRNSAKAIMKEKGKLLVSSNPLGFGNLELAVAFYYNTPNNTLPVIWRKKEGFWEPLFQRF